MQNGERKQSLTARDYGVAALVAVALAVLYFAFRTHYYHCDAVKTATSIDAPEIGIFLHQNHLVFTPLVWILVHGLRAFGWNGSVFAVAAAVSSIFGGAAAGGFFVFLRRMGVAVGAALLAVAAAAFSAAWWYNAGGAEQRSAIPFVIVGALLLLAKPARSWTSAVAVALWLGVGAWFHISISLFSPVAAILLAQRKEGRWLRLGLFSAIYAVVAFTPYVLVFRVFYRSSQGDSFFKWITFLHWWGGWGRLELVRFWDGALRLMASAIAPGQTINCLLTGINRGDFVPRLGPGLVLLGAVLAVIAFGAKRLWREKRWWLVAGITWFLVYHIFFSWWAPQNAEWWVATMVPLWLLLGLAAPTRISFVVPAAALMLCVAGVNFTRVILPNSYPGVDPARKTACVIADATEPGDIILISRMRVKIWIDNCTSRTRKKWGSGGHIDLREIKRFKRRYCRLSPDFTAGNAFLTDYEMDNPDLDPAPNGDNLRAALFRIIRGAEPVAVVPFNGYPRVLYRCRGAPELGRVRIYEAERGSRKGGFTALRKSGKAKVFKIKTPKEGRYVLCLQARGTPAGGRWPTARVFIDGKEASTFDVNTYHWAFYDTSARLGAGKHQVTVVLPNGGRNPATGEERYLYLNRLIVFRDPAESREEAAPPD